MNQDSITLVRMHIYECLDCGRQVRSAYNPGRCETCGGDMRDFSREKE